MKQHLSKEVVKIIYSTPSSKTLNILNGGLYLSVHVTVPQHLTSHLRRRGYSLRCNLGVGCVALTYRGVREAGNMFG